MDANRPNCPDTNLYEAGDISLDDFKTSSPGFALTVAQGRLIAMCQRPVLLRGESGTGKNFFARGIHNASDRARGPFGEVMVGGLPETQLYSALFGHAKGAFTGADADRKGAFELAHKGTLLLDEIGDLELDAQRVLLRAFSRRTFEALGGRTFTADVRILTATNRDIPALVAEGKFRADLYHRMKELTLDLPPLRERREDVKPLLLALLEARGRADLAREEAFEPEAWARLDAQPWAGNHRDLKRIAASVGIYVRGRKVRLEDLKLEELTRPAEAAIPQAIPGEVEPIRETIVRAFRGAVARFEGNHSRAARELEVDRRTLRKWLDPAGEGPTRLPA